MGNHYLDVDEPDNKCQSRDAEQRIAAVPYSSGWIRHCGMSFIFTNSQRRGDQPFSYKPRVLRLTNPASIQRVIAAKISDGRLSFSPRT